MSFVLDQKHVEALRLSSQVGFLQPVVVDEETGQVYIGRHRVLAVPSWPEVRIKVKDDLHRELIILNGNIQRTIKQAETKNRLNRIAQILVKSGVPPHEVCAEMCRLDPPILYDERYIRMCLDDCFKNPAKVRQQRKRRAEEFAETFPQTPPAPSTLEPATQKEATGEQLISYPFSDCRCQTCPNRSKCY